MQAQRTKYNVDKNIEKRSYDGIVFDSQMEMHFYRDHVLPQWRSGDIVEFELQKKYELQPKFVHDAKAVLPIVYVADFYLKYSDGTEEVIDIKGFADSVARIKRKMFWYIFPDLKYRWITYVKKWGGWVDYDMVNRLRKEARAKKKEEKDGNENED